MCTACFAVLLVFYPVHHLSIGAYTLVKICHIDVLSSASPESADDALRQQVLPAKEALAGESALMESPLTPMDPSLSLHGAGPFTPLLDYSFSVRLRC